MELKVWVEGIQRIVCGVNEKTTCQDVVFALAHATGKTGRFTLIERWRNSERLLAPNEQPLKVLLKWGEHSNDVQFILQWSPLDSSSSSNKSGQLQSSKAHVLSGIESSCSDNSSTHSPSPLLKPNNPYSASLSNQTGSNGVHSSLPQNNGPVLTKLPNSGSSSSYNSNISSDSRVGGSHSQNGPESLINNAISMEPQLNGEITPGFGVGRPCQRQNLSNDHSVFNSISSHSKSGPPIMQSLTKLKDVKLNSPPPYREPPSPTSHATPPLVSSPHGMSSPNTKNLPPYRDPPPPNISHNPPYLQKANDNSVAGLPSTSTGGNHPLPFNSSSVSSVLPNNKGGINDSYGFGVLSSKDSPQFSVSNSLHQQESYSSLKSGNEHSEAWSQKDPNSINGDIPSNQNGSKPKSSMYPPSQNSNMLYKDLIRMVNSQREKLTSQQAELTQFDAEIMFWEGKVKEQQRHIELINKEISRLEVISAQHETQLLSLAHLEEESGYVQHESLALKSEINSLRSELERCDSDIEQCKKRIRLLMDELQLTQSQMALRHEEWMLKEASTMSEIERLRRELDLARRETDSVQDLAGSLDQEVQSVENSLADKKKQMERLIAAMKEANLQSLSIQPPDELIEAHHRSGSTRRMIGSPRQLENAAPTSKNPHGVWV